MRSLFILLLSLSAIPLLAQTPPPNPPVLLHPNTTLPDPTVPPFPNPHNYYDPYGIRDQSGSAFSDANAAAMHFLNIVDNQIYYGAWLDASGLMHDVIPQKIWDAGMRAVRKPLGYVRARTVAGHHRAKSLPGGLTGDFMIINFDTEFSNKPDALETVTLILSGPLGQWRVICYNIGPR